MLAFPKEEFELRLKKVRARMQEKGVDLLVCMRPDNMYYLSGYRSLGSFAFQGLIIGLEGMPILFSRALEKNVIQATSWIESVRVYLDRENPFALFGEIVQDLKGARKRIGLELDSFSVSAKRYQQIREILPAATFIDASRLVSYGRLVKSEREIACVRKAAQLADVGLKAALGAIREGVYEYEIVAEVLKAQFSHGQDDDCATVLIGSGPSSALGHNTLRQRRVSRGEVVCVELAGCESLYCSNLIRTIHFGEVDEKLKRLYDVAREAYDAALAEVRSGVAASRVDRAAHEIVDQAGLGDLFARRTGYSIGIYSQPNLWIEDMSLVEGEEHLLEAGMTLAVEPGLNLFGLGGGKIGDTVLVTEEGYEHLTTPCREVMRK